MRLTIIGRLPFLRQELRCKEFYSQICRFFYEEGVGYLTSSIHIMMYYDIIVR